MVASKKSSSSHAKAKRASVEKKVAKPQAVSSSSSPLIDRRNCQDRRTGKDRRTQNIPVAVERRSLERRQKVNRRRQIDPTTCERDYTPDEIEFMGAIDEYKRRSGRMFPTCSEVLEVIRSLGYVKQPQPEPIAPPVVEMTLEMPQKTVLLD